MLPKFPNFKPIELSDKSDVETITSKYPPYSDFNFISMWSWDIKGQMRICQLNGNLAVRFTDYITSEPFYSFLGDNKVSESAKELLDLSKKDGLSPQLRLVPELVVKNLGKNFKCSEDRDNFDYIYDMQIMAELRGNNFQTQRNRINQFTKSYEKWEIKKVNFNETYNKNNILSLFAQWIKNKGDNLLAEEYKNEFLSLNKLLIINKPEVFNLTCFEIYIDNKLMGFIISERIGEYSVIHFEKADISFKGSYAFLMQQNSKMSAACDVKYLNFEQDLGVDSLRVSKTRYKPVNFLKKYFIQR
jgi:hypothetical protein